MMSTATLFLRSFRPHRTNSPSSCGRGGGGGAVRTARWHRFLSGLCRQPPVRRGQGGGWFSGRRAVVRTVHRCRFRYVRSSTKVCCQRARERIGDNGAEAWGGEGVGRRMRDAWILRGLPTNATIRGRWFLFMRCFNAIHPARIAFSNCTVCLRKQRAGERGVCREQKLDRKKSTSLRGRERKIGERNGREPRLR